MTKNTDSVHDINKFVGIPHYFGESSFDKCDCLGLCRLFYREHGYKEHIEDGKPIIEGKSFGAWRRLYTYLLKNMDRVTYENLRYGDLVVFGIEGEVHLGIYLSYGKLLAMQIPVKFGKTTSTIYHRDWWSRYFKYAFRRKG